MLAYAHVLIYCHSLGQLINIIYKDKMQFKLFFIILFVFFGFTAQAEQKNEKNKALNSQQQNFLDTYKALKKGEMIDSKGLEDYILYPYLEYQRIRRHTKLTSDKSLENYIKRYGNTPMAEKLWTVWLGRMAMRKQWQGVVDYYKEDTGGTSAKCYFLQAKIELALKNKDNIALDKNLNTAKELWLTGQRRPSACNPLFSVLKQKGRINQDAYWQRIALVMEKGKTSLANQLAKHLSSNDQKRIKLWTQARKNPKKSLKSDILDYQKEQTQTNKHRRKIIIYAIKRMARKKPSDAKSIWEKFKKRHAFTSEEKSEVLSYFGVREALNHSPYALRKLASIPAKYRSDDGNVWMGRMAVRQGDWKKVVDATDAMNEAEKQRDVWRYWRAHALQKTGPKAPANVLFKALAKDASFYGFLAADRLKLPYQRLLQTPKAWSKCTPKIAELESIKRAVELFAIGQPRLAKKEWFWTLKHLNKEGILAASAYAIETNQPFLSIITVSKTKDWNQVELRFPLQYQSLVKSSAKKHNITPAWVYGIMRRESAFDARIVSSAKAQGLMQVLPSTARGVAKRLGITDHQKSDLLIPKKNAHIGSAYLSGLLKKFKGNYVKATAAYNAGPGRVIKWAPDYNIDAPRWVESIPFTETRKYVRAVMSYTTIYDFKLHHQQGSDLRLSKRLKPVGPN